ncbi:MAG: hypothetical protein OXG27_01980 [Chloroflexi bacterium]|nr:hypothetical protein [Chloroflexota bacterium]
MHPGRIEQVAVADRHGVDELRREHGHIAVIDLNRLAVVALAQDRFADGYREAPTLGQRDSGLTLGADGSGRQSARPNRGPAADAHRGQRERAQRTIIRA